MGDIKMEPIKHYSFDIRFSQMEIDDASSTCKITAKIAAQVVDMAEEAIVEACVTAAREAGIHELYLLDRKFVIDALIEKITNAGRPEPVRHGKWIENYSYGAWHYDCPFCDDGYATKEREEKPVNYCPNCGAKMDLED